ncbi:trigger factor [Ectothiorhodospiraceae bacterium BW-2]|nr:trigger factor [Ectothiorhodospiraceae bacterium BW-2]
MQVSVEATGDIERKLTVQIPDAGVEAQLERRLNSMGKTVRMKGFRPGKVPFRVLKQQYGASIRNEITSELIQQSFAEALHQEELRPVNTPVFSQFKEEGNQFEYVATFEILPKLELAPLEGIEIERVEAEVTDADLDKMLETLRKQQASWEEISEAAIDGDRLTVDFHGTIDGEEFSGNRASNYVVTIGGKRMISGFEEGLVGGEAGRELTLELQFPDDYRLTTVAGKPVHFQVTVHKVERPSLPELDEAFAKKFGIEDGSLEQLRNEVRANMERELKQRIRQQVKKNVLGKLLELNPITAPTSLVEQETQLLLEQAKQNMTMPEGSDFKLSASAYTEAARTRVKLGILIGEIIRANNIAIDRQRVDDKLQEIAIAYEQPTAIIDWYRSHPESMNQIESAVIEDQVIDWVLENCQVTTTQSSFEKLVNNL